MSGSAEEIVFVRDRSGFWQLAPADDWLGLTLLGALSADPRSIDELERAWRRYHDPATGLEEVGQPLAQPQGPWILVDLACQRIAAGNGAELPETPAAYQRGEEERRIGAPLVWINLPPWWEIVAAAEWQACLAAPPPSAPEPLDVRRVLFGRPLAEGLARRAVEVARQTPLPAECVFSDDLWDDEPTDSQREAARRWGRLTVRVHADWLMTPREDLGGNCPRVFLHRDREWVERELAHRQQQWARLGGAPRPLDPDTHAYRFGPLGLNEVVVYFDLCREVIRRAWRCISEQPGVGEGELSQLLAEHAQWWLREGSFDGDPTPPSKIIESERRRVPLLADGSHLDCDCPICRAMADGAFGPSFTMFDGHHLELDDEFAFSLAETREQWEEEREELQAFDDEMDGTMEGRQQASAGDAELGSVWTSSYVNSDLVDQAGPLSSMRLMAVAIRVAELVGDLEQCGAERHLVTSLNTAFDECRAAHGDSALSRAKSVSLVEALEAVAAEHPNLTGKAADLQSMLDEWARHCGG